MKVMLWFECVPLTAKCLFSLGFWRILFDAWNQNPIDEVRAFGLTGCASITRDEGFKLHKCQPQCERPTCGVGKMLRQPWRHWFFPTSLCGVLVFRLDPAGGFQPPPSPPPPPPPPLTHSLPPSLPHARTHSRTHALTHSRAHVLTHARTHSRTHALTHSRTHARTHSRTHARTHALTHSLTFFNIDRVIFRRRSGRPWRRSNAFWTWSWPRATRRPCRRRPGCDSWTENGIFFLQSYCIQLY